MRNLIYADLSEQRLARSASGDALTLPSFTAGGTVRYGVRFLQYVAGAVQEVQPDIAAMRVSIGFRDARPVSGRYKIKIGAAAQSSTNTTAFLDWNASPATIAAALNAVEDGPGDFSCDSDAGSTLIRRAAGAAVGLTVVSNRLVPVSFGRIGGTQIDGEWVYDLRLTQMPLAFSDTAEQVLPGGPTIATVQDGGEAMESVWNEIQSLYLPPEFRGTYQLKRGYARTRLLDRTDGPTEIEEELNRILAVEGGSVTVTNPVDNTAHIEFKGELRGTDLEPLEVIVVDAPPGDWTFTLDLDTYAMRAALREEESLTVPFEAEADVYLNPDDHGEGTRTVKLWSATATLRRPLIWPELATVQAIDWLRPPSPKDYIPFTDDQLFTGQKAYAAVVGNGVAVEFHLAHGLGTDAIASVLVRENTAGGAVVTSGYSITVDSDEEITIAFDTAPTLNQYAVVITAAPPVAAWTTHTHTIQQIDTLQTILEDFGSRIEALEAILPRAGSATAGTTATPAEFKLPDIGEILADIEALEATVTLASQVIVGGGNQPPQPPSGTELADREEREAEEREAAERDPDALPPEVITRLSIPGIGRAATNAKPAERGADGTIVVPEVPATDADPALWPARTNPAKWPLLLPAIEDASVADVTALPGSLPSWPGQVYRNTHTGELLLPGGGGRKSQRVPVNGLFGSDGRSWYRVVREGSTNFYHALEMERELWRAFIGLEQMPDGSVLEVAGEIRHRMIGDFFDDDARNLPRVDYGGSYILRAELVPVAGGGVNAGAISTAVVLGSTRLALSPSLETMRWALRLARNGGALAATWRAYGAAQAATASSVSAFALRLRLVNFDVDDASADPRGQIALVMPGTRLEIKMQT